jgi:hypothetical protein
MDTDRCTFSFMAGQGQLPFSFMARTGSAVSLAYGMDRDSHKFRLMAGTETAVLFALLHGQTQLKLWLYGMYRDSCTVSFMTWTEIDITLDLRAWTETALSVTSWHGQRLEYL